MRTPHARGMTLIEVMVVVAILAILAAISATALTPMVGRYRQLVSAEAVAQIVAKARVEARQQTRCYRVQVLAAGVPVAPGTPGDTLRVMRRVDADCQTGTPVLAADTRIDDVRLPRGTQALVPALLTEPEFRPNGYTQNGLDTEIQVGPAGAPTAKIAIRSYGPICSLPIASVQPCP